MFSLAGISFHLYGLVVGLAIVVGVQGAEYLADRYQVGESLKKIMVLILIFGLMGARLWHVLTDWQLYQNDWWRVVAVWEGGLSVIGAIIGGAVGLWLGRQWLAKKLSLTLILDMAALVLPLSQTIGRLGNYVNQELYGTPTNLPWGIYIEPAYRLPSVLSFERFHPLFAYEMAAMMVLGAALWWVEHTVKTQPLRLPASARRFFHMGMGNYFLVYAAAYSVIRIMLDNLRIEPAAFLATNLGFNQVVLGVVAIAAVSLLIRRMYAQSSN